MASELPEPGKQIDRYLVLLGLISVTLVLLMLVDFRALDSLTANVLFIAVTMLSAGTLVAALWTSAARPRLVRLAATFGVLGVVAAAVVVVSGSSYRPGIIWVAFLVITPGVVVRRIASHEQVTNETILGAISAYLLIALAFSYIFLSMDSPGSLLFGSPQPSTAFPYFSLVTITTLGYGDLAPATEAARALATMEAIIGQVFLVVFVARMVSLYARRPRPAPPRPT